MEGGGALSSLPVLPQGKALELMFMLDPLYTARLDPFLEGFLVREKVQTTPT